MRHQTPLLYHVLGNTVPLKEITASYHKAKIALKSALDKTASFRNRLFTLILLPKHRCIWMAKGTNMKSRSVSQNKLVKTVALYKKIMLSKHANVLKIAKTESRQSIYILCAIDNEKLIDK